MKNVVKKVIVMIIIFISILCFYKVKSYAVQNSYYITVNYGSNVVTIYTKDAMRKFFCAI